MNQKSLLGLALILSAAIAAWSCEGMSPAAPSTVGRSAATNVRPFDEAPAPGAGMPDPAAPDPAAPDPGAPVPTPAPDPGAPVLPAPPTTINIVGTDGAIAFAPNPILAAVGATIVFTNGDTRFHHIVLDDGRDVGDVMPGGSTVPIEVTTTAPMPFHCTVHPSMVGSINGEIPTGPPPPAPGPYEPPGYYDPDPYGGYY
jgi:plastocyanin